MVQGPEINITDILTELICRIISFSTEFRHIDCRRILICISSNRRRSRGGTYGKLVPLRFKHGVEILKFNRSYYTMPKIIHNEYEILYLIYFYMPRFFDLPPEQKLRVVFHELYHISPAFNGDIRRMGTKKSAHGFSKDRYNAFCSSDLPQFLTTIQNTMLHDFLALDSKRIFSMYARILGRRMTLPKPVIIKGN